jgi:hypothetical protein
MRTHFTALLRALALMFQAVNVVNSKVLCVAGKCNVGHGLLVAEMDETAIVEIESQEIIFSDPGRDFEELFRCQKGSGKKLCFNGDHKYVACCLPYVL